VKKGMLIGTLTIVMVCFNSILFERVTDAGQNQEKIFLATASNAGEKSSPSNSYKADKESLIEAYDSKLSADSDPAEISTLKIPQRLELVVDPWEIEGKGQIYSEKYVVHNSGDKEGTLVLLNLACNPEGKNDVFVKTDPKGIHDDEKKSIYIEMVFSSGYKIVLSQEISEYTIELQPDEEASFYFTGEINENALGPWEKDDIKVTAVYFWGNKTEVEQMLKKKKEEYKESLAENKINGELEIEETGEIKDGLMVTIEGVGKISK